MARNINIETIENGGGNIKRKIAAALSKAASIMAAAGNDVAPAAAAKIKTAA